MSLFVFCRSFTPFLDQGQEAVHHLGVPEQLRGQNWLHHQWLRDPGERGLRGDSGENMHGERYDISHIIFILKKLSPETSADR